MKAFDRPAPSQGELSPAEFYEQVASRYDQAWALSPEMSMRQAAWLARFCRPGPLLDLGCGTGRMLEVLARAGFKPVGLDCSPNMLSRARQALEASPLVLADAGRRLPFADCSFDIVISLHSTLVHLVEDQARNIVAREALRVLRPGGHLVIELPHPRTFPQPGPAQGWQPFQPGISCLRLEINQALLRLDEYHGLITRVHVFTVDELPAWLGGFQPIHLHPGFLGGRFSLNKGQVMVLHARKPSGSRPLIN